MIVKTKEYMKEEICIPHEYEYNCLLLHGMTVLAFSSFPSHLPHNLRF